MEGQKLSARDEMLLALRAVIGPNGKLIVIHSSLLHLRPPSGAGKWDFLYALEVLRGEGRTIAVPAFTFGFCRGDAYSANDSKSETGQLADWAAGLSEFQRTPHPIYSYVVGGPLAGELLAAKNSTTFGDDSMLAVFERLNALTVMLGCGWEYCTQCHRYEEEAKVPYRYFKTFRGRADFGTGAQDVEAQMFVRDLALDPRNDFSPVVARLRSDRAVRTASLWHGTVEAAACTDIGRAARALLQEDPWALVQDGRITSHRFAAQERAAKQPPFKVALLGSANLELVKNALSEALAKAMPDRRTQVFTPPYGQVAQEILAPSSELRSFRANVTVFADRPEDLVGAPMLAMAEPQMLERGVDQYLAMIKAYRKDFGGWIVVNRFAEIPTTQSALGPAGGAPGEIVAAFNRRLEDEIGKLPETYLFDLASAAADFASGQAFDHRLWHIGRFPFSDGFSRYLAGRYAGLAVACSGRAARVLVVDLDNTMWGGVVGEDGIAGLKLGGDYPGNAYMNFQKVLKGLSDRGIAIALSSKNDADLAWAAIRTLPAMQIRQDDIVANRINWEPKWRNISEICEELNLGLDHVLFIDDNPVEREAVRRNLPEVKVLDLPDDPALYAHALLQSPWVQCLAVTPEDLKRVRSYQARAALEAEKAAAADLSTFYASLNMRLYLMPVDEGNIARTVQLINKTNQFNARTALYDQKQLQDFVAQGHLVVVIGAEDRFSVFENIGVLMVKWDHPKPRMAMVENYLLSCRVIGRGLETGVLAWLMEKARARGMTTVAGEIIETERNTPVRSIFRDAGFTPGPGKGEWRISLGSNRGGVQDWITVVDQMTVSKKIVA